MVRYQYPLGRGLARRIPSSSIQLKTLPSEEPKAGLSVFLTQGTHVLMEGGTEFLVFGRAQL